MLALAWRYRAGCIRVLLVQIATLLMSLGAIGFTGLGIDVLRHAMDPAAPEPGWLPGLAPPASWGPMAAVAFVAGLVLIAAILRALFQHFNTVWLNELVQGCLVVDLRAEVYDRMQRLSFRFFDANASSSLINRVTADVQSVRMFVDGVVLQVIVAAISLAAYAAYMFKIHPGLAVACLAPTPLLWAASRSFSRQVQPAYAKSRELADDMVQRLVENLRGIRVVKAFAREAEEIRRFAESNQTLRDQQRWIFWRVSVFSPLINFLSLLPIGVLLGYGGMLAIRGEIAIGTGLVSFASILQQFAGQISNIANIANSMQQSLRGAARVFEVLDAPMEIATPSNPVRIVKPQGAVAFEHVWFDHGRDPILQDIHFSVDPGECVAIVGPTGAGKSALMSLLPRFYDPTSGCVLFDGTDLRKLDLEQLRRCIGVVFQESFLFSVSVAENIAFGHPEATREQIERAAKIAAAHDFITALPEGYDTILGESGIGLSGGQRQRLAIARALLLEPPLLMLDDPTASVDPGTENEIIEAMEAAMQGRTTFLVAHRPAALKRAHRIYVLERGRIAACGTHEELMRKPGYYRDAVERQVRQSKGIPA